MASTMTINDDDSLPNPELDYVKKNLISKRCISQREVSNAVAGSASSLSFAETCREN